MSEDFVRFEGVRKAFGPKVVFADLNLSVHRGEVLTLLGGSGTGKSVLLKLLIGLLGTDAGHIVVDGSDVAAFTEDQFRPVRRRVSMLFQSSALFDSLSVAENVAYPLRIARTLTEAELRVRVEERLTMVGLPGIGEMRPSDLSGGMRKRVGLARAIAGDPQMILYDEPTTGLDPINTRRINDLILSIQDRLKVTSLVVTHDLSSAFAISDRIAMLSEGRIVAVLPPEEFRASTQPSIQEFLTGAPAFESRRSA
jgi:phospholipid/cholesterol/gamma-HCH transport system ATP-binding protein